jgi:hypothetical protein
MGANAGDILTQNGQAIGTVIDFDSNTGQATIVLDEVAHTLQPICTTCKLNLKYVGGCPWRKKIYDNKCLFYVHNPDWVKKFFGGSTTVNVGPIYGQDVWNSADTQESDDDDYENYIYETECIK